MAANTVENKKNKSAFKVSRVIRILLLMCMIFVFCPMFFVSCSGQTVDVSVMTAVKGIKVYGENIIRPQPIMLITLLIPLAVIFVSFSKKFTPSKAATCSMICMIVDFIVWLIFKSAAVRIAKENMCMFEISAWFYLNMSVIILLIILNLLVVSHILQFDTDLCSFVTGTSKQDSDNKSSGIQESIKNIFGKFTAVTAAVKNKAVVKEKVTESCVEAETEVQEMETETVEENSAETPEEKLISDSTEVKEEYIYCTQCGAKIDSDSAFCTKCGAEVK